jgi:CheY-like chemotaxis protein/anti-sigma regulatory factor (Ser/Thr protein kinase)
VVEETLALLRSTLPPSVELRTAFALEPLWVRADSTQLQQVLLNLCTNAWHALPGGKGRIEVGMAATGEEAVSFWVADNGQGIDEATRARIFEPYFTTKPVDQGSGLGLAVVHGIVKAHGGQIHLESRPGLGSRFTVELPGASAEPRPAADAPPSPPRAPELKPEHPGLPRTGHVLYVDDEELMRLLVGELLAQGGHRVTLCSQATQALAHLQDDGMAFDLVVTDFNMPGASGLDLAREVARARPGLPVVISSGHVAESLRTEARQAGVFHVMHKEQTLETLGEVVARALNTR